MSEKKLIIVESPTKAKTISKFLDGNCKIVASNGHIRTMPKDGLCVDIKNGYQPEYIEDEAKSKIITQLKAELKNSDELILATDEDREGESISWHLIQVLKPKIPYRRMVFHEITKKAILAAFNNGRELDMNLVHAQEARRVLDRLYGYTISPVLWSKLSNKTLSAGRVQSPGLRLIVDREKLRLSYKKAEYMDIEALFDENFKCKLDTYKGKKIATGKDFDSETGKYTGTSKHLLLTSDKTQAIVDALKNCGYSVTNIKEKSVTQKPYPPFTTSTLQQEGNRKLRLSAKDTMKLAQSLYENGFITYMRTDSTALSQEGIEAARVAAKNLFGDEYVADSPRHYQTKSANAQEAHEAIRPSGEVFKLPEETGLSGKELALYRMIFNRTLACQMKDSKKFTTTYTVSAFSPENSQKSDDVCATLTTSGTRIDFYGYLKVYVEGTDDEESQDEDEQVILPKLEVGDRLKLKNIGVNSHETKAPARYTEASLVRELEKKGIGRPSTYASIIDRILEKRYVLREGSALIPTFTGFGVVNLLENYFKNRIDYQFTSQMEEDLDKIASGEKPEVEYLTSFFEGDNGLQKQIQDVKNSIDSKKVKKLTLPQLKEENFITLGPFGPYVQNTEGKFVSVPESWTPASVTDEMIENLKNGNDSSDSNSSSPAVVGKTDSGLPILYCTGRYGDYWQIGNKAETSDVKRLKVPNDLKGKVLSGDTIAALFNLPRIVGTDESGNEISAALGRYGAYIKCLDDYRNIKNTEDLLTITEAEARQIFSMPKSSTSRSTAGKTAKSGGSSSKSQNKAVNAIKDFGDWEGQNLAIRSGRYGFYLKYGNDNFRIPVEYRKDEAACMEMSKEEAVSYLKGTTKKD